MLNNNTVHIVMDKDLKNRLKEWCAKNNRSMKIVIDELVSKLIDSEVTE